MRCILLLITLLLLSGYYDYGYYPFGYYGYGYGGYPYGLYVVQQPHHGYEPHAGGSTDHSYSQPAVLDPGNCGTPDEPKPCYQRYR